MYIILYKDHFVKKRVLCYTMKKTRETLMKRYKILIDGMGCQHCVNAVQNALTGIGASVENVEIGFAVICFEGDIATAKEAIEDCGFDVKGISLA